MASGGLGAGLTPGFPAVSGRRLPPLGTETSLPVMVGGSAGSGLSGSMALGVRKSGSEGRAEVAGAAGGDPEQSAGDRDSASLAAAP